MAEWIMYVQSYVFSKIVSEFSDELKTAYSITTNNFSTVESSNEDAVFPFVYVHLLPATESGIELENDRINGGIFTFQVEVYDNQSQPRVREVMGEIVRIMKKMRFEINSMPELNKSDINSATARFRRAIGSSDII